MRWWPAKVSVVGLLAVGPLIYDPWGLQGFLVVKVLVTVVALSVGFLSLRGIGPVIPRSRTALVSGGILLLALIVGAATSRAPLAAFLGAGERLTGVLSWLLYALAFLLGLNLFAGTDRKLVSVAVTASAVAVLIISTLGILEALGIDLITYGQSFGSRTQALFGNPAVLGALLVLYLPISGGVLLAGHRRLLHGAALGMGTLALVLSGTRGAWVGASIGTLILGYSVLGPRLGVKRLLLYGAATAALLIAITIPTGRWSSLALAFEGRTATWGIAAEVIADHPAFGVGPEGFGAAFNETVDEGFVVTYTRDQLNDRAHNGILDFTLAAGIIGLIPYLVLIGGVLVVARRTIAGDDPILVGVAAGVVGYLVQQQFFFPHPVTDLVFWFLVGLLAVSVTAVRGIGDRTLGGVVAVVCAAAIYVAGTALVADHFDRNGLGATSYKEALEAFESAAALRPEATIHYFIAGSVLRDAPDPELVRSAIDLTDRGLRWAPDDQLLITAKVNLLLQEHRLTDSFEPLDAAQPLLEETLARDQTNGEFYLKLGTLFYYRGDFDSAEENWRRAAGLMPHREAPQRNLAILAEERAG